MIRVKLLGLLFDINVKKNSTSSTTPMEYTARLDNCSNMGDYSSMSNGHVWFGYEKVLWGVRTFF